MVSAVVITLFDIFQPPDQSFHHLIVCAAEVLSIVQRDPVANIDMARRIISLLAIGLMFQRATASQSIPQTQLDMANTYSASRFSGS